MAMTEIDELGPVDYLVVEFPQASPTSRGRWQLSWQSWSTQDDSYPGPFVMAKGADGEIEGMEIEDLEQVDELRKAEADLAEILAVEDVANLAAAMEPGTTAGVLVWRTPGQPHSPRPPAARRPGHRQGRSRPKPYSPRSKPTR